MRVAVIILGTLAGLVMFDLTGVPMRLGVLISSSERPHEAVGAIVLFVLWIVATALVYSHPGIASWLFVLVGGIGLYDGVAYSIEEFTLWGCLAIGLAALTSVARQEKRLADRIEWARAQHELAMHAALRSLHETVPELLARAAERDESYPGVDRLVQLRPAPTEARETARR